jgi:membrane-bound metal-dependent hydrolase YbcI (DUF457 family)
MSRLTLSSSAGLTIDLDHVIAARSIAPERLMGLAARPPSHSLLGTAALALATSSLAGPRLGWGVWVGLTTHLPWDAAAAPGVPLLVPLVANPHVVIPTWAFLVGLAALAVANTCCAPPTRLRAVARQARG